MRIKYSFGFPDSTLGDHIERTYQALALNETSPFHMAYPGAEASVIHYP